MLWKNLKMTVRLGKVFAAIAFIITSTVLNACSTQTPQNTVVPNQPQSNQQPNQQSNQADNDDDDKDDDDKDDKD